MKNITTLTDLEILKLASHTLRTRWIDAYDRMVSGGRLAKEYFEKLDKQFTELNCEIERLENSDTN